MTKPARGLHRWLLPLMLALPLCAAVAFAVLRWGDVLKELIAVALKVMVIS